MGNGESGVRADIADLFGEAQEQSSWGVKVDRNEYANAYRTFKASDQRGLSQARGELVREYVLERGMTIAEAGRRLDLTATGAGYWLWKDGVRVGPWRPPSPVERDARIVAAMRAGAHVRDVARRHDLDPAGVYMVLKRAGVKLGKGRKGAPGVSKHGKLTPEQVRAVRASTETYRVLGARYGVSIGTIGAIKNGTTYKSIV